jgi:hypothetical protein
MDGLRRPVQIGWAQLELQFGAAYSSTRFFRRQ